MCEERVCSEKRLLQLCVLTVMTTHLAKSTFSQNSVMSEGIFCDWLPAAMDRRRRREREKEREGERKMWETDNKNTLLSKKKKKKPNKISIQHILKILTTSWLIMDVAFQWSDWSDKFVNVLSRTYFKVYILNNVTTWGGVWPSGKIIIYIVRQITGSKPAQTTLCWYSSKNNLFMYVD